MEKNKRKRILVLPNILTILRIILSPVFLVLLLKLDSFIPGLVVFVIVALTDVVDGEIARRTKQRTDFGEFLDPMADKFMVLLAIIALLTRFKFPLYGLWIFIRDIISLSGSVLIHKKERGNWKASKLGKITTFMQTAVIIVFIIDNPLKYVILWLTLLVSVTTAVQYFIRGFRIIKGKK